MLSVSYLRVCAEMWISQESNAKMIPFAARAAVPFYYLNNFVIFFINELMILVQVPIFGFEFFFSRLTKKVYGFFIYVIHICCFI